MTGVLSLHRHLTLCRKKNHAVHIDLPLLLHQAQQQIYSSYFYLLTICYMLTGSLSWFSLYILKIIFFSFVIRKKTLVTYAKIRKLGIETVIFLALVTGKTSKVGNMLNKLILSRHFS